MVNYSEYLPIDFTSIEERLLGLLVKDGYASLAAYFQNDLCWRLAFRGYDECHLPVSGKLHHYPSVIAIKVREYLQLPPLPVYQVKLPYLGE